LEGKTARLSVAYQSKIIISDTLNAGGSFLASDAFLPFADNIEIAAAYKISAIVAPKGSIRDEEVIAKADEKNIALYFVETRHFKH
jgi:phosphoribosylaminoimidazolecarboxamide formyltransferase/IMP cyclohydrolase